MQVIEFLLSDYSSSNSISNPAKRIYISLTFFVSQSLDHLDLTLKQGNSNEAPGPNNEYSPQDDADSGGEDEVEDGDEDEAEEMADEDEVDEGG